MDGGRDVGGKSICEETGLRRLVSDSIIEYRPELTLRGRCSSHPGMMHCVRIR